MTEDEPPPDTSFADAHAALTQAREALDVAAASIVDAERRCGTDRRVRARICPVRADRRGPEIERLEEMGPDETVTVPRLAEYWKPCHPNSVLYYISKGKLKATKTTRGYLVRVADALAFEPLLYRRP